MAFTHLYLSSLKQNIEEDNQKIKEYYNIIQNLVYNLQNLPENDPEQEIIYIKILWLENRIKMISKHKSEMESYLNDLMRGLKTKEEIRKEEVREMIKSSKTNLDNPSNSPSNNPVNNSVNKENPTECFATLQAPNVNIQTTLKSYSIPCLVDKQKVKGGQGKPTWINFLDYKNADLRNLFEESKRLNCKNLGHEIIVKELVFDTQYGEVPSFFAMCEKCGITTWGCDSVQDALNEWKNNKVRNLGELGGWNVNKGEEVWKGFVEEIGNNERNERKG